VKEINLERLKDLVLARLLVGGTKASHARADVAAALFPLVSRQLTKAEWDERLEAVLGSLRADAYVESLGADPPARGGARKNAAARSTAKAALVITKAGSRRLCAALGLKSAPKWKNWDQAKARGLPRLALGTLPTAQTGKVRPSVAVVAQRLGVDPSAQQKTTETRKNKAQPKRKQVESKVAADVTRVVDAWLCTSLGLPDGEKLTLNAVRGALLSKEFGTSTRALSTVLNIAVASVSGATSGDDAAVTEALTSRWLFDEPAAAPPVPQPAPRQPPPAPRPAYSAAPVELIAAKALQAADGPDARQYGPNKVFIGSVWRALMGDPEIAQLGEAAFKRQLAEAHRRGLLKLGRADLVAAMDPSEVSASEIVHQNATYHFILRGASA